MAASEQVHEQLEHAVHATAHGGVPNARRAAVLIAALAAALAICETAGKDAQTSFLANHISASNTWSQYQAKSVRRVVLNQSADILQAIPTEDPTDRARHVGEIRTQADRMRYESGADGMEQLAVRAHDLEHARNHQAHRHHGLEMASGGLQLSIVLISVSLITGVGALLIGGGILGLSAAAYGLLAAASLV